MPSSREQYLMDLLGFNTTEQLTEFLNSPDQPTGNMVPQGQIQREMQILVEGKEEIHRLFMSLDGEVRREIDTGIANKLLTEERAKDHRQLAGSLKAGQAARTNSLDAVYRVSEGLTRQTSELGLGKVATPEDFFKIEQKILDSAAQHRTLGESQLLARMRVVRAAAQDQVLRELAEVAADEFRAEAENVRESPGEKAVHFPSQAENSQKGFGESKPELGKQEATSALHAADFNHNNVPGLVACTESVTKASGGSKEDPWREAVNHAWNEVLNQTIQTTEMPEAHADAVGAVGGILRTLDAGPLQSLRQTGHFSVRQLWPFLTVAAIVGAWLRSPFNAVPAFVLLTVSLIVGFRTFKNRPSPILLKSALLFLVLFVPTGMIHDAFFDHPAAICSDGTYSYSHHRAGTCSSHQGVSRWQPERKHWWQPWSEYGSSGTPSYHRRSGRIPSRM